ncbi:hypothetical protein ES705_49910 [subsurface metagenome]
MRLNRECFRLVGYCKDEDIEGLLNYQFLRECYHLAGCRQDEDR